jgi:hypothetical protein
MGLYEMPVCFHAEQSAGNSIADAAWTKVEFDTENYDYGSVFDNAANFRFTFSVAACKLSATALNEIYTNLPSVVTQTITVSNNYGTAGDDPTIAQNKGWTVTG